MTRYRSRPVEITAERWTAVRQPPEGVYDIRRSAADGQSKMHWCGTVDTIGGPARVWLGDWVIAERWSRKFYPCAPDVFAARWEPIS